MLSTALLTASCALGSDYHTPRSNFIDEWFSQSHSDKSVKTEDIKLDWWTIFKDPLLKSYIEQAVKNNNDVKIALANIERAQALRRQHGAAFWPSIDADSGIERSKTSDKTSSSGNGALNTTYSAGLNASWELDLFGGNRRANEAASAREQSAVADYHAVMLSTLAQVAQNYYEARGLQKRIATARKNAALLKKTSDVIQSRYEAGESSEFDLSRAKGQYQLTRAAIPNLQAEYYASVFTLSILLGQPPEALISDMQRMQPLPTPPDMVPVGLRSDMLRRRPDIQAAERELAASVSDIGAAMSDLFPKFFLTGAAGAQAHLFGDLFEAAAGAWSFGPAMSWSIFNGGANRADPSVRPV